jgi:hypothetical protein
MMMVSLLLLMTMIMMMLLLLLLLLMFPDPRQVQRLRDECLNRKAKIDKMRDAWEGYLDRVKDKLHAKFAVYMSQMKCGGMIELLKPDRFADWGLQISVKFRENTPLNPLSARMQSGGERSVSTILFLMALQVGFPGLPRRGSVLVASYGRGPVGNDDVRKLCHGNSKWIVMFLLSEPVGVLSLSH